MSLSGGIKPGRVGSTGTGRYKGDLLAGDRSVTGNNLGPNQPRERVRWANQLAFPQPDSPRRTGILAEIKPESVGHWVGEDWRIVEEMSRPNDSTEEAAGGGTAMREELRRGDASGGIIYGTFMFVE